MGNIANSPDTRHPPPIPRIDPRYPDHLALTEALGIVIAVRNGEAVGDDLLARVQVALFHAIDMAHELERGAELAATATPPLKLIRGSKRHGNPFGLSRRQRSAAQ